MKNKFLLTTAIAYTFMFINCSDNTDKETTEKKGDDESKIETVMSVTTDHVREDVPSEHKYKGLP